MSPARSFDEPKWTPILMADTSIRAIYAGTKTQTRRVVNPQPERVRNRHVISPPYPKGTYLWPSNLARTMVEPRDMGSLGPYGGRGDRLWVKEAWATFADANEAGQVLGGPVYRATWPPSFEERHDAGLLRKPARWRTPLFMPRNASRLSLAIKRIRVERLHAITEAGAKAEGIHEFRLPGGSIFGVQGVKGTDVGITAVEAYATLWDSLNRKRAPWKSNPWVWKISFERLEATR